MSSFYREPGPLTELSANQIALVRALDPDPVVLGQVVQGLVVSPQ